MEWIWNLRISYLYNKIYAVDDNITSVFRNLCYHPSLVAMHSFIILGFLFMYNRLTFGDNTSPSNFKIIAKARSQVAKHLWQQGDSIISTAQKYLPTIKLSPEPSTPQSRAFAQALADTRHKGVFNNEGSRKLPPFHHHVDDNLYAEVKQYILRAITCSLIAIYMVLGYPDGTQPDPFSFDKFDTLISHQRKMTGIMVDTRTLKLLLPAYKRQILVDLLAEA